MEAVQLSTRPLGECGFQLSSIGACSFGHKGTISGLRPLNQIDKECKLYWNSSSMHTMRHWNTMKHVMPSVPTIQHLTNKPHLCQQVNLSISVLTTLNNTIYATLARPQRPHWLPRLNIIFECQMSGHFKSMYIYVLYCTPIFTSLSLQCLTSAAPIQAHWLFNDFFSEALEKNIGLKWHLI